MKKLIQKEGYHGLGLLHRWRGLWLVFVLAAGNLSAADVLVGTFGPWYGGDVNNHAYVTFYVYTVDSTHLKIVTAYTNQAGGYVYGKVTVGGSTWFTDYAGSSHTRSGTEGDTVALVFTVGGNYNGSSFGSSHTDSATYTFGQAPTQTAVVQMPPGPYVAGNSYSGFVTGSQSGNPYNASVVSGGGSVAIDSETGEFTVFTPANSGTQVVRFWISDGWGWVRSADVDQTLTVSPSKKVKVTLPANTGAFPIQYTLTQNGVVVGTAIQQAGAAAQIVTVTVPDSGPVQLTATLLGVGKDGTSWIADGVSNVDMGVIATLTPEASDTPTNHDAPIPNTPTSPDPNNPPNTRPPGQVNTKVIWSTSGQSSNPSQQTDLLTNKTYREGVEKLLDAQGSTSSEVGAADDVAASIKDLSAQRPIDGVMTDRGHSEASALSDVFDAVGSRPVTAIDLPDSSEPSLSVSFPARFGGKTFNLNPFTSDRFGGVVSWFRGAMAWLVLVLLARHCWTRISEWTKGLATIRQARGNPVLAGTGAQATGLLAAGLMTVAVTVAVTALLGWFYGDISITYLVTILHSNPLTGLFSGSVWMLNQYLPVGTIVSAAVAAASFEMYSATVFAFCMTVIRFIVP